MQHILSGNSITIARRNCNERRGQEPGVEGGETVVAAAAAALKILRAAAEANPKIKNREF